MINNIEKSLYIFFLICSNFFLLKKTIINKLLSLLNNKIKKKRANRSIVYYKFDNTNDKKDPLVEKIFENILNELYKKNLYTKKDLGNNLKKSWVNVNDKFYKAEQVVKVIKKNIINKRNFFANPIYNKKLKILKRDGIVRLDNFNLSEKETSEIVNSFKKIKGYPSHVPWQSQSKKIPFSEMKKTAFGTYDLQDIVTNQNKKLIKILFNQDVLLLVEKYFGCAPTLCSINTYWNFSHKEKIGPKFFHRDVDDYKQVNIFCILTKTKKLDGSYSHILNTNNPTKINDYLIKNKKNKFGLTAKDIFDLPINGYGFDNFYQNIFKDKIKNYYGASGQIIIADGYCLHKANLTFNDRLMFWGSFSLIKTATQMAQKPLQEKIKHSNVKNFFKNDLRNKYIFRHFIQF